MRRITFTDPYLTWDLGTVYCQVIWWQVEVLPLNHSANVVTYYNLLFVMCNTLTKFILIIIIIFLIIQQTSYEYI